MRLVKDGDIFESDNENFISAYKENGYVEVQEKAEPKPEKTTKKTK